MVLYIEIAFDSEKQQKGKYFLYEFTGNTKFPEESLINYYETSSTEIQLDIKHKEAYYKVAETRVYPKHRQHIRALIHFLLTENWPDPSTTLTTVYDYPSFISTTRFDFQQDVL